MGILDRFNGLFADPQIPQGGVMGEPQFNPQGDARLAMASALLSGSSGGPQYKGFGEIMGNALMAGQAARQQAQQLQMRQAALQSEQRVNDAQVKHMGAGAGSGSQIGSVSPHDYTPESVAKFQQTGNYGDLVAVAGEKTGINSPFGNINPGDFEPASVEKYRQTINSATGIGDFSVLRRIWAPPTVSVQTSPGMGTSIVDPANRLGGGTVKHITTPEQERAAASAAAQATKEAEARGARQSTFNADIAKIDDEIKRTDRVLNDFKAGKYQTGPIAGKLPNYRTAAQDLQAEQGKDVLSAISQATFGALSEGERAFLKDLGISENKNEAANINLLDKRAKQLKITRDRLIKQGTQDKGGNGGFTITPVNP